MSRFITAALLPVFLVLNSASAETVLVGDEAALSAALRNARPGAVIQIKAGTYRGGISASLRGEKGRPITIEAADPQHPPMIEGGAAGMHLSDARNVTLRNLTIRGATGNGMNIDDGGTMDQSATGIVIENITVQDIGPKGNNDGIKLSGLRDFVVRGCTVEGWGGNAIDLVGCADGVIERCTVRGKKGFEQATGPQLKGGTHNVTVRDCLFDHAGSRALNAGGSTGLEYFRPRDATYEAKDLTIENNVFVGSDAPIAFVGVDGAVFRHNTIIEPEKWVMRVLQESRNVRFARCRNVIFERNLIVYRKAAVKVAVNVGPDTEPQSFAFKDNWWWCSDAPNDRPNLPTPEKGGIYGRDPQLQKLDSSHPVPANKQAAAYGASPSK